MAKSRIGFTLLAACLLGCGNLLQAAPPPSAAQMLQFKPKQAGVPISTPTEAELPNCKVELIKGQKLASGKTASGWLLRDPQGRMLRRFFDSDGDNQIDVWSYYLNGEECYREVDTNFDGKPDQYRWLGANGSKWGVDLNEDGVIDTWRVISPEEVSQEVLAAVMTRDIVRLQALMINKADLDALELPASEAARIKTKMQAAAATFQATAAALAKLNPQTKWVHLELAVPECVPADALGAKLDLTHHTHGTILYSDGDKVNDFLQTGELIQVGRAWRIIEAPVPGGVNQNNGQNGAGTGIAVADNIKKFLDPLKVIDEKYKSASTPAQLAEYNMARAAVLENIVGALQTKQEREDWIKQVADCYGTAAQNGDRAALAKLTEWTTKLVKQEPGSNIAGYLAYREMTADYARKLSDVKPADMTKLQDEWKDRLAKFVQDFPNVEDAPDALMQLGMVNEFIGKETEAKNWYGELVKNFPKSPQMPKADGAIRRLTCEGKVFDLASKTLGTGSGFDVKGLNAKIVLVYYWASWNTQCVADFAKIKQLLTVYGPKGVELVCVNLDSNPADAIKFLQTTPVAGTHLYEKGVPDGQDSPLAVNYGIMVLPHMFILDNQKIVASRNAQVATLEEDLKKLVK